MEEVDPGPEPLWKRGEAPTYPVKGTHTKLGSQERDGGIIWLEPDAFLQHLHSSGRLHGDRVIL